MRRKGIFLALVVATLALFLFKPVCDVHTALAGGSFDQRATAALHAHHGGESAPCCSTVDPGGVATHAGAATLAWPGGQSVPLVPVTAFVFVAAAFGVRRTYTPSGAPPGSLSYYARSSRILR